MANRNPSNINKKLRSLTKDQAAGLAGALNSAYPGVKKPATKKPATKKKSGK